MESTLALPKSALDLEVADFAGFGIDADEWTERQLGQINRSVKTGLRGVYFTQEVVSKDGKLFIEGGYSWSFLKPVKEITLLEGESTVALPDDFGGIEGRVIPSSSSTGPFFPIPIIGEAQMHQMISVSSDATGQPCYALVEAIKGTSATKGSRSQLRFYPEADQDYTLKVWYSILPDAITDALPYVYGGAQHAETFKCAVRAAYEQDFDGQMGPETARFQERLKASIAMDRKMKPVALGANRDSSDDFFGNGNTTHGFNVMSFDVNGYVPGIWNVY